MKSGKFDQLPNLDERLVVAVPTETKAQLFALAAKRGISTSMLIRQALAVVVDEPRAA